MAPTKKASKVQNEKKKKKNSFVSQRAIVFIATNDQQGTSVQHSTCDEIAAFSARLGHGALLLGFVLQSAGARLSQPPCCCFHLCKEAVKN